MFFLPAQKEDRERYIMIVETLIVKRMVDIDKHTP